jgi:hypothetical protein
MAMHRMLLPLMRRAEFPAVRAPTNIGPDGFGPDPKLGRDAGMFV